MSRTVLCADVDRQLCQILARALGADGIRLVAAHDGEAALAAVEHAKPAMAILDLGLPGCDGLGVLAALRKAGGTMPALLLASAAPSAAMIERARRLRASAILVKPVALDALASRVTKLLPADRRLAVRPGARPRPARAAPLRGSLETLPIPALLHQVHGLRASGVLRLEDGDRRKALELVDGRPAAVRSNLPGERLGDFLLRAGRIDTTTFQESIRRMRRGEGLQGEILLAMEALSEAELRSVLAQHADEKLFEIFQWTRGRFELALGSRLDRASALGVSRSAADVIRIGLETRFPIERIDAVLRRHVGDVAFTGANPFYSFQEIELSEDDRRLLRESTRGIPVQRLLAGPPELRRTAYALLVTELLELREGSAVRSGGAAAQVRLHAGPSSPARPAPPGPPAGPPARSSQRAEASSSQRAGAASSQRAGAASPRQAGARSPQRAAATSERPSPARVDQRAAGRTDQRAAAGMDRRAAAGTDPRAAAGVDPRVAAGSASPGTAAGRREIENGADHSHYAADHDQRAALTDLLVRLRHPSPFEKLGLPPDASTAEIRASYAELAKRAHPDRYAKASHAVRELAEEAFREITRAYRVLADPEQLETYRRDPERDAKNERAMQEAQRVLAAEQEFQRGEARLRIYDWAGALAHFERAVELYPDEGEYVAYCGWAYYLTHGHSPATFSHAFGLVKKGAKLAPDRDKPYLFLGRLCQAAGKLDLAEKMFTRAVERRPDCTEALRELRLLAMRKPKQGIVGRLLRRAGGERRRGRSA